MIDEQPSSLVRFHPWRRLIARFYDYFLVYFILDYISYRYILSVNPEADLKIYVGLLPPIIWVLVESLLLTSIGTTPGKWLLGIRVLAESGDRPRLLQSFTRSFHVWLRGLALSAPLLSTFAMFLAYTNLKRHRRSTWDVRAGTDLEYSNVEIVRYVVAVAIGVIIFWFWFL